MAAGAYWEEPYLRHRTPPVPRGLNVRAAELQVFNL
jgi:hypothetical protein